MNDKSIVSTDLFIGIFALFYAAWGLGQANQFGPDIGKSMLSAKKIFKILNSKSQLDVKVESEKKIAFPLHFKG